MDHQAFAELLGNYGEFVGSIAVVATLAYLALQVRHQHRESHAAAMHDIWTSFRDATSALGDPQVADVYTKAEAQKELTDAEQMQLLVYVQCVLRVWEEAFWQKRKGRLDDEVWAAMLLQIKFAINAQAFKSVWALRKDVFDHAFKDFIDGLARKNYGIREMVENG